MEQWFNQKQCLYNYSVLFVIDLDSKSKEFLYAQIESVLLNNEKGQNIDTSQQGGIEW